MAQASDAGIAWLDLSGSVTWTGSCILQNDKFPQSAGQLQPRVPRWRAMVLATCRPDAQWSGSIGARYSGCQYGTLDNSDMNGAAYTGFSEFFVGDVRLRYQSRRQWGAALGIDNVNKAKYWAFHPYAQRTVMAELT